MTYLFPELRRDQEATPPQCNSIARSFCDPSQYSEVVGIDFGSNSVHYYMARSKQSGKMAFGDLLAWLLRLNPSTLVVCESAHLGVPQTQQSLAQPFTAEQLIGLNVRLLEQKVTLKLAPHAHTGKRMRLWVSHHYPELMRTAEKTDAADAMSLAVFVDRCNDLSLAKAYTSFGRSKRRDFGRAVTRLSNSVLNAERTSDYRGECFPIVIKLARKVWQRGGFPSLKFVVSVASTLFGEEEGRLFEFTHCGQRPGAWFWMRHVVRMTPWHHRGGVARSNIMWHAFKPYFQRRAKRLGLSVKSGGAYKKFAFHSNQEKEARTSAMKSYRQVLLRAREMCIRQAACMGAGEMELTEVLEESTHGTST